MANVKLHAVRSTCAIMAVVMLVLSPVGNAAATKTMAVDADLTDLVKLRCDGALM